MFSGRKTPGLQIVDSNRLGDSSRMGAVPQSAVGRRPASSAWNTAESRFFADGSAAVSGAASSTDLLFVRPPRRRLGFVVGAGLALALVFVGGVVWVTGRSPQAPVEAPVATAEQAPVTVGPPIERREQPFGPPEVASDPTPARAAALAPSTGAAPPPTTAPVAHAAKRATKSGKAARKTGARRHAKRARRGSRA